ncbi:MAG: hypothetical protein Q8N23_34920 [Archangium sp.]|nr:hypothetical protein [Archangium sp.]MDP3157916.1 hypothetical protein [Archangium sp.]MDP3571842.1 hypothetical protein [Archangium sp.]
MKRALVLSSAVTFCACVTAQDNPTNVHDLRVLGMRMEPPEVLMRGCNVELLLGVVGGGGSLDGGTFMLPPQAVAALGSSLITPINFSALIADPAGAGRSLDYRLLTCASRGDRDCNNEGDFLELAAGTTTGGELKLNNVSPVFYLGPDAGIRTLDDGSATPLFFEVINQDTFKGLGGIRIPVVLELSAADTGEKIYAQKLMIYTCNLFPEMKQNVTPVLPGLTFDGDPWLEGEVKKVKGNAAIPFEAMNFTDLEEDYVVPSLELKPVALKESWKISWMTTSGTMSTYNTGGTGFDGETERHFSSWRPNPADDAEKDVEFYFVVRDGRGGNSWTKRSVRWIP